jgi:hypothetical protein
LEHPQTIRAAQAIEVVEKQVLIPNLKNVQSMFSAQTLRASLSVTVGLWDFWAAHFQKAWAGLQSYSLLRELLVLQ